MLDIFLFKGSLLVFNDFAQAFLEEIYDRVSTLAIQNSEGTYNNDNKISKIKSKGSDNNSPSKASSKSGGLNIRII